MANAFLPVPRTWRILETDSYRQLKLPPGVPREFKSGDAMWLNTYTSSNLIDSWIESALNSPSGYSTRAVASATSLASTYVSTSTSAAAEEEAFAALFIGILQDHRTPRSFAKYQAFATTVANSSIQYDSSAPFATVVTSGIADVPYWDGTNSAIPSGYEYPVGNGVTLSTFDNTSTGFYDASGIEMTATKYWCYPNSVQMTSTAAAMIGRLVRNAKAGDPTVRVAFSSYLSVPASGQVAGVLLPN